MKLRRKLLSAGFALGATALTLTTSTFAWYTANNEVEAGSVSGITSTQADASSFYIASVADYTSAGLVSVIGDYTNEATPNLIGGNDDDDHILAPVSYVDASGAIGKYLPMSSAGATYVYTSVESPTSANIANYYVSTGANAYAKASGTTIDDGTTYYTRAKSNPNYAEYDTANVYEWVYRFRTAEKGTSLPLYFKDFSFTTSKVASGYRDIQALAVAENNDRNINVGITSTGAYFADLAKAMKLTIVATDMSDKDTLTSTKTTATYSLASWATASDSNIGTANAVGYYNVVLGADLVKPVSYDSEQAAVSANTNSLAFATIPASSGYVEVRFTLWLDGWDEYCYDVMRQQVFNLAFNVSSTAQTANTLTVAA